MRFIPIFRRFQNDGYQCGVWSYVMFKLFLEHIDSDNFNAPRLRPFQVYASAYQTCGASRAPCFLVALACLTCGATKFRSFRGPAGHARGRHGVARRGPLPILGCPILPLWCRECP